MTFLSRCITAIVDFNDARKIAAIKEKHGLMDKWGALCDNVVTDIAYAPGEAANKLLTLDVYFNNHEGLQPIVVNIHGGGWMFGDKNQAQEIFRSKYMARCGYVVANVNYRLYPVPIKTQLEDVLGATLWIKKHAAEYGADPARIGVTGDSAGGHLAAMVAWVNNDSYFVPTGHINSGRDLKVLAATLFYGVYDIERVMRRKKWMGRFTGLNAFWKIKNAAEREDAIRRLSPKNRVSPDIPPSFFICGDEDEFALYRDSIDLEKLLRQQGVETGLYMAKGGRHAFDLNYAANFTQEAMKATAEWFDKYLK